MPWQRHGASRRAYVCVYEIRRCVRLCWRDRISLAVLATYATTPPATWVLEEPVALPTHAVLHAGYMCSSTYACSHTAHPLFVCQQRLLCCA
jgi:hypothetical protein